MKPAFKFSTAWRAASAGIIAAIVAACSAPPKTLPSGASNPKTPPSSPPAPVATQPTTPASMMPVSNASDPRDYRRDAASHLYSQNTHRIFQGKMPPLLYAIGVLQVELDGQGQVINLDWMRAPKQAPEVIAEIERTVRQAAPFPKPVRLGKVTYTDTWLWHSSGRFQLDTLTEGQL